jgi:hypothetical protein
MKTFITAFFAVALSTTVFAGPPVFNTLENSRGKMKFPEYTLAQRKTVLSDAKMIINDIYINKEIKIKDFGINPSKDLAEIEKNVETMPIQEFHERLSALFTSFRDRHTLYYFPKPFACYNTSLPLVLREVLNEKGESVIAITGVGSNPDVIKLLKSPILAKRGDTLIGYDGMPVGEAIEKGMPISFGANKSSARMLAISDLVFIEHDLSLLPKKDSVKLVFKNRQGKTYSQELPWIVKTDWSCLGNSDEKSAPREDNNDDMFAYHVLKNQYGDFGYIWINSFEASQLSDSQIVTRFKEIMRDDFANTDGLMIDIRGNGGGSTVIAERMLQLFSPKPVKPLNYIFKVTAPTLHMMKTVFPNDPFTAAAIEAQAQGKAYTKPLPLISEEQMNDLGQFYFKPVAVFNDGICYSACDMLSAQMQDNKLGVVFGENESTGGGGANVFKLSKTLSNLASSPGPFKPLPNGQDIIFAFRQTIRTGVNAGKLIENVGVKSDIINPPTIKDIYLDDAEQLMIVGKYLSDKSPDYTSWAEMTEARLDFKVGSVPSTLVKWQDSDAMTFSEDGISLGSVSTEMNKSNGKAIKLPIKTTAAKTGRLSLVGTLQNKNVWRKILNYRVVPPSLKIVSPLNVAPQLFSFYTFNTSARDSWQIKGQSLRFGSTEKYQDDAHGEASLFVTPVEKMVLSFKAEVDTEKDCDLFKVIVVSEGKEIEVVAPVSGKEAMKEYKVDLSEYVGKQIEVRFIFDSDDGLGGKGVTVQEISFSGQ